MTPLDKPLVLLVDDDEDVLRGLRVVLRRRYTVEICTDPEKAVQLVKKLSPLVVVLDIRMPKYDGFWVFQEIRKFDPHVPIIFNSAYQDARPPDDLRMNYGAVKILVKGSGARAFSSAVDDAAAEALAHRAKQL